MADVCCSELHCKLQYTAEQLRAASSKQTLPVEGRRLRPSTSLHNKLYVSGVTLVFCKCDSLHENGNIIGTQVRINIKTKKALNEHRTNNNKYFSVINFYRRACRRVQRENQTSFKNYLSILNYFDVQHKWNGPMMTLFNNICQGLKTAFG